MTDRHVDQTHSKFRRKARDMTTDQLESAIENIDDYDDRWSSISDELKAKRRAFKAEVESRE